MDLGLKDKVAAVTASSLGLGQAIAMELAREGAKVAICARRQGPLDETRAAIEAAGGEALACVADMNKREDVEAFVNDAADHFGGLDVLVNNAGDAAVGRTIEDPDEVWEQTYDINLWSAVRATRAAVPLMRKQGSGSIVNVASVSGHSGLGGMADYNSAKAAMLALTKTLAQDLAGDGIRVNAVNPALIHTPLWERLAEESFVGTAGRGRRRGLQEPLRPAPADPPLRTPGRGFGGRRLPRFGSGELRHRSLLERRRRFHEVPDLRGAHSRAVFVFGCRARARQVPRAKAAGERPCRRRQGRLTLFDLRLQGLPPHPDPRRTRVTPVLSAPIRPRPSSTGVSGVRPRCAVQ